MNDEELADRLLQNTSEGMSVAIELYGGAVKKICRTILAGYQNEDINNVIKIADVDVERETVQKVDYQILNEMIMELKSPDKEIFIYRYYEQYSIKEIAEKLMITAKTVENKIARGRARLKKKLIQCGVSV